MDNIDVVSRVKSIVIINSFVIITWTEPAP